MELIQAFDLIEVNEIEKEKKKKKKSLFKCQGQLMSSLLCIYMSRVLKMVSNMGQNVSPCLPAIAGR